VPFVYHLCADDFRGTSLLPLNALRVAYPDVYDRECAEWAGREAVLQWQVPHLGVAWSDTVNLSFATSSSPARSTSAVSRGTASDRHRSRPRDSGFRSAIGMVAS